MGSSLGKVLIVAEDASLRSRIRRTLELCEFDIGEASDSETTWMRLRMADYEAVLLDFPMRGEDGIVVCRRLRGLYPRLSILIMGGDDCLNHKVEAFEAGADDYVVRSLSEQELSLRLRSAIRRYRALVLVGAERIVIGHIALDSTRRRVEKAGSHIPLTPLEFRALNVLMAHAGQPIAHAALLNILWGQKGAQHREHLRVLISALRKKLEDDPVHPAYLLTHSHFGYLFRDE